MPSYAENIGKKVKRYNKLKQDDFKVKLDGKTKKERANIITELNKIAEIDGYLTRFTVCNYDGSKRYFCLNDYVHELFDILEDGGTYDLDVEHKSDAAVKSIVNVQRVNFLKVKRRQKLNVNDNGDGGFFPYILTTDDLNLDRYQIYNSKKFNEKMTDINNENCFVFSLRMAGINEFLLNTIKASINNGKINMRSISKLCLDTNIRILIHKYTLKKDGTKKGKQFTKCGPPSKNLDDYIKIGLIEEHFFLIEDTMYSSYCINNLNVICHLNKFNHITGKNKNGSYKVEPSRTINSFDLIRMLVENSDKENSLIKKLDTSQILSCVYNKNTTLNKLDYDAEISSKPIEYKVKESPSKFKVFFDFETNTRRTHKAYLVCYSVTYEDKRIYKNHTRGTYCARDFITDIYNLLEKYNKKNNTNIWDILFLAHNINYDIKFISEFLSRINFCYRGSMSVCGGTAMYKPIESTNWITIHIRDTYALIPAPLRKFNEMFGLAKDVIKEVIPYEIYNDSSVFEEDPTFNIQTAASYIKDEEKRNNFIDNIDKLKLKAEDKKYFHMLDYAQYYCEKDVEVMEAGYAKFKIDLQEDFKLDLDAYLTISSIADDYFKSTGCYEDCFFLSGIPRIFIQNAIVGGRTMCAENMMYKTNQRITPLDGVSLYPSAMRRMPGFLKGLPKVLSEEQIKNLNNLKKRDDILKSFTSYFVEIKVTEVNKNYSFPLLSEKNDKDVRMYTNNAPKKSIIIDKTGLEDLIEYQKIKFEIIKGYFFTEGHNNTINNVIKRIFDMRVELKAANNPKQEIYKLIMNSAYGKTMIKENKKQRYFFDSKVKADKFIHKNYNHVIEIVKLFSLGDRKKKYLVEVSKCLSEHFNAVHIGCEILSMSKRIMNEVMCLAEDLKIKIFYQDTDSLHLLDAEVKLLADEFNKKFKRDLLGNDLGQFHCDFEPRKVDGKKVNGEIMCSVNAIYLAKKAYIEKVEYWNPKANTFHYHHHYRMKGIPQDVIQKKVDEEFEGDPMALYQYLFDHKVIEFDILSCGIKFKNNKNFSVETRDKFPREVSF